MNYISVVVYESTNSQIYNTNLTVTDIYGRIILTKTIKEGENKIYLEQLPNGYYIFALENGDIYKILKA